MVYFSDESIDLTFAALADPTRRAIVARLSQAPLLSVSDIAAPLPISLMGVMKHIGVLERAGLVKREKTGRTVHCRLDAQPMASAAQWLAHYRQFWERRLDALAAFVESDTWDDSSTTKRSRNPPPGKQASHSRGTSKRPRSGSSPRGPSRKR